MLDVEVTMAFLEEYEALARKYQRVIGANKCLESPLIVYQVNLAPNYIDKHIEQLKVGTAVCKSLYALRG